MKEESAGVAHATLQMISRAHGARVSTARLLLKRRAGTCRYSSTGVLTDRFALWVDLKSKPRAGLRMSARAQGLLRIQGRPSEQISILYRCRRACQVERTRGRTCRRTKLDPEFKYKLSSRAVSHHHGQEPPRAQASANSNHVSAHATQAQLHIQVLESAAVQVKDDEAQVPRPASASHPRLQQLQIHLRVWSLECARNEAVQSSPRQASSANQAHFMSGNGAGHPRLDISHRPELTTAHLPTPNSRFTSTASTAGNSPSGAPGRVDGQGRGWRCASQDPL